MNKLGEKCNLNLSKCTSLNITFLKYKGLHGPLDFGYMNILT